MKRVDKNNSGTIEWLEFLDMMTNLAELSLGLRKINSDNVHAMEEISSFSRLINSRLKSNATLKAKEYLPIDPNSSNDIFDVLYDGMVGLHMLNLIEKDRIDFRAVN